MSTTQGPGAIASNVLVVLRAFQDLVKSLAGESGSSNTHTILPGFEEEMMRFKMWSGNLGAHQSGRVSLDHRLRDAPHLREQVIYLLKDLCESLQDALSLASHQPPLWQTKDVGEATSMSHSSDFALTDSDSDSDFPESGLLTARTDVEEAIDCLLRLSVAIANPAPHERVQNLGTGPSDDVSFYETFDIQRVRDKFPKISTELAETLGKSITRRRQFFKYREAHHTKLSAGLEAALNRETDTSRTEIVPKTVASSLPDYLKKLTNIDLTMDVIDEDGRSETGMSQTSYATSAGVLEDSNDPEKRPPPLLKVPPLPEAARRGNFECPFCYRMISASSWRAWKRHVFGDLRPYTCIFSDCKESNADFDRRHLWQLHVSQHHWRSWFCPFRCEGTFPSATELKLHIGQKHLKNAPEEQLSTLATLGEKPVSDDTASTCPVCAQTIVGLKSYIKHVGRHLEQLALIALPDLEDEEAGDEGGSVEQNSAASEVITDDVNISDVASTSPSLRRRLQEPEDAIVPGSGVYSLYDDEIRLGDQALSETQDEEPRLWNEGADSQQHESAHVENFQEEPTTKPEVEVAGSSQVLRAGTEAEEDDPMVTVEELAAQTRVAIATGDAGKTTIIAEVKSAISKLEERNALSKAERETLRDLKESIRESEEVIRNLAETPTIQAPLGEEQLPPIRFTDAVGRKFSFPFHLCKSWQGMEELINQAFLQVDVLSPHVQEGHYDLISPNSDGEIILPSVWEKVIQPGWDITMTMWPMDELPQFRPKQNVPPTLAPGRQPHHFKPIVSPEATASTPSGTPETKDEVRPQIPDHIMNHVEKMNFRVPARIAEAEASKWVEELKERYGKVLQVMENIKQKVTQLDKLITDRASQGNPLKEEELRSLQTQREILLEDHSKCRNWVDALWERQSNIQGNTQAAQRGPPGVLVNAVDYGWINEISSVDPDDSAWRKNEHLK
ncbi:hypothetical protein EDB81DRAFT_942832 [Dactylonectria macrodidyma]|uniref:C2H2-type domain-containing protein n=1 Tax=Dactylonectria macrodidyma TaxID=307937 RepID=A0A9P9JMR6_9HYPO|nr:hypothetical protein EDB81DRAFT_942832 [Dactylonectria macrodidyma]